MNIEWRPFDLMPYEPSLFVSLATMFFLLYVLIVIVIHLYFNVYTYKPKNTFIGVYVYIYIYGGAFIRGVPRFAIGGIGLASPGISWPSSMN